KLRFAASANGWPRWPRWLSVVRTGSYPGLSQPATASTTAAASGHATPAHAAMRARAASRPPWYGFADDGAIPVDSAVTAPRPAAGGGRWVDVPPERLERWLADF